MTLFSHNPLRRTVDDDNDEKSNNADNQQTPLLASSSPQRQLLNSSPPPSPPPLMNMNTAKNENSMMNAGSDTSTTNNTPSNITTNSNNSTDIISFENDTFQIRIKVNDGKSTSDLILPNINPNTMNVGQLKQRIFEAHCHRCQQQSSHLQPNPSQDQQQLQNKHYSEGEHYLRLIVRGKMMAPDSTPLHQFGVEQNDVVHAVLLAVGGHPAAGGAAASNAGTGVGGVGAAGTLGAGSFGRGDRRGPIVRVGGGQQARALRRLNNEFGGGGGAGLVQRGGGGSGGGRGGGGGDGAATLNTASWRNRQSLWRRIGIDATNNNGNDDSEEEDDEDDDDEANNNEVDLELGTNRQGRRERRSRRRTPRERRGFDRLRSTGMSREEVMAIRSYFASSVDRYIERRRAMMRAAARHLSNNRRSRLRERRGDGIAGNVASGATITGGDGAEGGGDASASSRSRRRTGTGESTNSLLDTTEDEDEDEVDGSGGNVEVERVEEGGRSRDNLIIDGGGSGGAGEGGGRIESGTAGQTATATTSFEGEEIFNDRLRMEDEWMAAQGPFSEFRMNLNTSNPLLMAAITQGMNATGGPLDTTAPLGLFSRSRNLGLYHGLVSSTEDGTGDDDDEMFSGAFTSSGAFVHSNNVGSDAYRRYAGPLPSAGTEKDLVWGFLLGFFVGFIMLFWVWMPSVPHRQKIGIILGISAQLGINLLRKSGRGDAAI